LSSPLLGCANAAVASAAAKTKTRVFFMNWVPLLMLLVDRYWLANVDLMAETVHRNGSAIAHVT
jgi:hypothetical protein